MVYTFLNFFTNYCLINFIDAKTQSLTMSIIINHIAFIDELFKQNINFMSSCLIQYLTYLINGKMPRTKNTSRLISIYFINILLIYLPKFIKLKYIFQIKIHYDHCIAKMMENWRYLLRRRRFV